MAGQNYGGEPLPPATRPDSAPVAEIANTKRRSRKPRDGSAPTGSNRGAPNDIQGFNGERIALAQDAAHQCQMLCKFLLATLAENRQEDSFVDRAVASRAVALAEAASVLLCAPHDAIVGEMADWELLINGQSNARAQPGETL